MSRNGATLSIGLLAGTMIVYRYSSESLATLSSHVSTGATSRVVCLGDTHGRHAEFDVPDGDVLVYSGDFSMFGSGEDIASFNLWLAKLPYRRKVGGTKLARNRQASVEQEACIVADQRTVSAGRDGRTGAGHRWGAEGLWFAMAAAVLGIRRQHP